MSLLNDTTIRAEIAKGNLILGADDAFISQCSYAFRVGKIFTGGETGAVIDWTNAAAHDAFLIKPGSMGWVRMREQVKLPANICATWLQTNTLSRKGIMLVNMSIVDPGYEGPLSCLFVNFGKSTVLIDDTTPIAKLLFQTVNQDVAVPASYPTTLQKYDSELQGVAVNGGSSFLRLDELSAELEVKKRKVLEDIAADAPKALRGAFLWAFAGIVLLIAATTFIPWAQSLLRPNLQETITDAVDARLMERSAPLPAATQREIDALRQEIRELKARNAGPGAAQGR